MVSDMNIFVWKLSKIASQKNVFFFTFFDLLRFSVFFNGLFAPTSRSRISNIFRDSESLGKSNGKKWSHIWTFLFGSGLKSPRKKKFFFVLILQAVILVWCGYIEIGFFLHKSLKLSKIVLVLRSASVERFDVSRMRDFFEHDKIFFYYFLLKSGTK